MVATDKQTAGLALAVYKGGGGGGLSCTAAAAIRHGLPRIAAWLLKVREALIMLQ